MNRVYFIGGAPRVGKSIIAKEITDITNGTLIHTDDVCDEYQSALSEDDRRVLFPFPCFDGDPKKNVLPPEELVRLQYASASSLSATLIETLRKMLERESCIVIEGIHIIPEFVKQCISDLGLTNEQYRVLFIGSCDAKRIEEGIQKNTDPGNWLKESDPAVIRQVAAFSAAFSERLKVETLECHFPYVERTSDFNNDLENMKHSLLI